MMGRGVDFQRNEHRQHTCRFGERLRFEQILAHVRVHDDRIGRLIGRLCAGERTALQPVLGVNQRVLAGNLRDAEPLHADAQPGRVHHREHGPHALVRLADEPARGAVEIHDAGGRSLDAHLVLDRPAGHGIALARLAIRVR